MPWIAGTITGTLALVVLTLVFGDGEPLIKNFLVAAITTSLTMLINWLFIWLRSGENQPALDTTVTAGSTTSPHAR